jgi:hypothetical protein
MKARDVHRFFEELNRRIDVPIRVVLTGGAAALLQGVTRATQDIDFELKLLKAAAPNWERVQNAIEETGRVTGITPQYAEDIDRWSSIILPGKKSRLYSKIGKVEVRLLDPAYWAIGKFTRYLSSDIEDLRAVFRHTGIDPYSLAKLLGKALGFSPASSSQNMFRKQVESFFDTYAHDTWGSKVDPITLKRMFFDSAKRAKRRSS